MGIISIEKLTISSGNIQFHHFSRLSSLHLFSFKRRFAFYSASLSIFISPDLDSQSPNQFARIMCPKIPRRFFFFFNIGTENISLTRAFGRKLT